MEGSNLGRGKYKLQSPSESEIKGRRRTHGGVQAAHKLNETQQEEVRECGDETEKEHINQQLTNKNGGEREGDKKNRNNLVSSIHMR